jgi:outer membrane protein assembly factor BamB
MPSLTRRQVLATAGSASVALAGCLLDSPSGDLGRVEGAWPMIGRDPGHARRAEDGPTDPRTVWTTELDQVRSAGPPSVQDGRLYVPADAVSDRARHRYRIHALSASTGEERWQVPLRSEPNGPPAVSGDHVVVTARRSLERGRVVCFQRRYGDEEWLVDVDARLTAPPTVDGRVVYVPDWSGRVHAPSMTDGSVLWSRWIDAGRGRTFAEPVAVHDGTLYLGSMSGTTGVVALDAETGAERWRGDTGAVTGGPVVDGDLVVVRSHHLVVAFDADGTRRWSVNVLEADARPMAVDDRHVYVPARERLHAITRDGESAWSHDSTDGRVGTPTVAGDSVLLRGADRLTSLSRTDGEERWTVRPDGIGGVVVTPEAAFLTDGGRVLALGSA